MKAIGKGKKAFLLRALAALVILTMCISPALTSLSAYADDGAAAAVAVPAVEAPAVEATDVEAAPAVETAAVEATDVETAPAVETAAVEATDVETAAAVEATEAVEATATEANTEVNAEAELNTEANAEVNAEAAEADTGEALAAENTGEATAETTDIEATAVEANTEVNAEAELNTEANAEVNAEAAEADTGEALAAENTEEAATTTESTEEAAETDSEAEVNTEANAEVNDEASLSTDKADYGPNDLATFEGGDFTPNSEVTLTLTEPNGVETVWTATTDDTGSFATTYQLVAGMQDTYILTATDGTTSAQASFTDAWTYYGLLGQKIWTVDDPSATIYWISNQPGANNTTLLQQDVTNERAALNGRVQPVGVLLLDGSNNLTSQFTVNKVAPSGTWLNIGPGNTGTLEGTVTADAGTTYEGLVDVTTGIYGENKIPWVGWSPTLVHIGTTTYVFGVDSTSPDVTGTLPEAGRYWYNNDVTVIWLAEDQAGLSGICQVGGDPTWNSFTQGDTSVSGSSTTTAQGVYSLTGTATDCASNPGSGTIGFGIDLKDPKLNGTAKGTQTNGWFTNPANARVQWVAKDTLSGLPDGSGGWTTDKVIWLVSIPEGKNQSFTETVTDQAGNSTSETVSGVDADYTAPTVTRVASAPTGNNGWYVAPVDVTLTADDATSGLNWLRYWIDGNRTQLNGQGANTLTTNFQINQEGAAVELENRAKDVAGNISPRTAEDYKIDWTEPTLVKDAARTGESEITVTLTGADAISGVDFIRYSTDGGTSWTTVQSDTTTFTITGVGDHNLGHLVFDIAGNEYVLADQTLTIDAPGGGGGTGTTGEAVGTVASLLITTEGELLEDIEITSPDGVVTLNISAGTWLTNPDGTPVTNVDDFQILPVEGVTAPDGYQLIGSAYQFTPSDITFSPDATLTISYDPAAVPEGSTLVIAYYDEATGTWVELPTTESAPGTLTAPAGSGYTFAIFAK